MSFLDLFRRTEARNALSVYQPWPANFSNGTGLADSGKYVVPDSALMCSVVFACCRLIAGNIASLPLFPYQKQSDSGRKQATRHFSYRLLRGQPNELQTVFQWLCMKVYHLLLTGNAYSQMVLDGAGKVTALYPLNPLRMKVWLTPDRQSLVYEYVSDRGQSRYFKREEITHWIYLTLDGITGVNPIAYARNSIGLAVAQEEYSSKVLANGASPIGILKFPQVLTEEAFQKVRESWNAMYKGSVNAGKVAILDRGMEFQRIGLSNEDIQFLEDKKFQIADIAGRIYGVPLHMVAELSNATFSNISHQQIEFMQMTLRPILVAIEQCLNRDLLIGTDRERYYFEFLIDGIERADIDTRFNAYMKGRQWGWLSTNDIRRKENLEPLAPEIGDQYLRPLNMVPAETPPVIPEGKEQTPGGDDSASIRGVLKPVFEDIFKRIYGKNTRKIEQLCKNSANFAEIDKKLVEFYRDQRSGFAQMLLPAVLAYAGSAGVVSDAESIEAGRLADELAGESIDYALGSLNRLVADGRSLGEIPQEMHTGGENLAQAMVMTALEVCGGRYEKA